MTAKKTLTASELVSNEESFVTPTVATTAPVSSFQVKYEQYLQMALGKNQEPKESGHFYDERAIGAEMQVIYAMPSAKTQELFRIKQSNLGATPVDYTFFYGKTQQQISDLIKILDEKDKATAETRPASKEQAEYISDMFYCPDVDFSNTPITTKILLDEVTISADGETKQLWRRPTRAEMAQDIQECMRSAEARDFINQYRTAFAEWKKDRPTRPQIDYVILLQNNMANTAKNRTKLEVLDDGTVVEVPADKEWNPVGYVGYKEEELAMMSKDEINTYIDQLKAEMKIVKAPYTNENDGELKKKFDALEQKSLSNEDFVYALMAVDGCEDELLVHNANKSKYVVQFIKYLLDKKYITVSGLETLAGNNEFAQLCIVKALKK